MELIQWEIPALLWEKRNSIVKFSKRVPTKIEQVCPNLTEVISEQTSNLPFLHALERQSKGKFPPFCPRRGLDPNCRGGRKVGEEYFLIRAIKLHKGCVWKSEKRTRVWYEGESFCRGGVRTLFRRRESEGGGHVGSPQPFSGTRGQKRRVRGPLSVKNRF